MVLPILAALPMIFEGIDMVSDLFGEGKKVYEAVTGEKAPETRSALKTAVDSMPEDQRAQWAEQMKAKTEDYKARTERIEVQGGRIDAETLLAVPERARAKIAMMRMMTRPWAVRQMVRVLMTPAYVVWVDGLLAFINIWLTFFDSQKQLTLLAATFFDGNKVYVDLYAQVAWPATLIVTGYMGLREIGKAKGHADDVSLSGLAGRVTDLVKKIRS